MPHRAIRAIAARHPAIAEALWRDCMVDAAILSQWVVNVGRRDARARIAHLLCEIAVRCGVDRQPEAVLFEFAITQAQLADATGLTPVHVNRTLKSLRDEGVVFLSGGMIHVLDWSELVGVGEFDRTYLQADTKPEERIRILQIA